jgi:hypothetical protein
MGVEFIPCSGCEEVRNDCEWYAYCSKCEECYWDCCYPEQEKKYGTVTSKKDIAWYGEDALKECDKCSDLNKQNRIDELKRQLALEESK